MDPLRSLQCIAWAVTWQKGKEATRSGSEEPEPRKLLQRSLSRCPWRSELLVFECQLEDMRTASGTTHFSGASGLKR